MQAEPVKVMFNPLTAQVPIADKREFIWATNVVRVVVPVIGLFNTLRPLHKILSRGTSNVPVVAFLIGNMVIVTLVDEHRSLAEL